MHVFRLRNECYFVTQVFTDGRIGLAPVFVLQTVGGRGRLGNLCIDTKPCDLVGIDRISAKAADKPSQLNAHCRASC